ncbi:MAG TPA: DUF5060 domain-containing protein [Saprospiraceae bacterium]|nr:DUF5060 domain-containing protein [Saprospiraceae bacterium]HMQ81408.1 DUF5060 domain-containing protein [Saprospiraceae bacterium]
MKRAIRFFFLTLSTLFLNASAAKADELAVPNQMPEITILSPQVDQFAKFEARIDFTATYTNPYDYDQISVRATFIAPDGQEKSVDGFFMYDYTLNTSTGNLSLLGSGEFRVRFAPDQVGTWQIRVAITDINGTMESDVQSFNCTPISNSSNNRGFLRSGSSNYLHFDDGSPYIAIGQNVAWQNSNPYLNYQTWLSGMTENGANFFRLWHAHWGLGIEWSNGNGFEGLRKYKQSNCFYQDWLFDYCAENGLYIMLTLQHHGPVSTQVNPNWNESPYNASNGGPCQNTVDFFTNAEAKAHTKNRYRYILARWGYARSILCWELFNEVHWTDNFQANKDLVADWHIEMAEYLKSNDPYEHLVTTSYGDNLIDENVWSHPSIDFTQTHIYINTPNIERVLAQGNRNFLDHFGKPTLNGEFGLGSTSSLANEDPSGIHFHNSLWGGLFSGALGTAMTWWWDSYIHPQNLYHHFSGLSQFATDLPFQNSFFTPALTRVTGAPGDLMLSTSLGWGIIGEDQIEVDENGNVLPLGAGLGLFLYGSQWNTQYRSPPTFSVYYPEAGHFSVKTSGETGTSPKIAIWLDGNLVLEQSALPNATYAISVPEGNHSIKVDNTGTDWITIAYYAFEGLGSRVDAYVLVSEEKNVAAGWALNTDYNHLYFAENGVPTPAPACTVQLEGFQDGAYTVRWFNPLTYAPYGSQTAVASNQVLNIPLPVLTWDVAFVVDDTPVNTLENQRQLSFDLYPVPALAGQALHVRLPDNLNGHPTVNLMDISGKSIHTAVLTSDGITFLSADLPAGLYWIKVACEGMLGVKPIVIAQQ